MDGWGGLSHSWEVEDLQEYNAHIFGGAQITGNDTQFAIFLRGGGTNGALYHVYSDIKLDENQYDYGWDDEVERYVAHVLPGPQIAYNSDLCFGAPKSNVDQHDEYGYFDLTYKIYAPSPKSMILDPSTNRYVRTDAQNRDIKLHYSIKLSQSNNTTLQKTVKTVDVEYYLSTSSIECTGGSWVTTAPEWVDGKYMWSRQKITFVDNTTETKNTTCIAGAKGNTGNTGATGTGIESIEEEYYLSTSKSSQTGGSWSTTAPTWSNGKFIWTRSKITYKNPTSIAYTTPLCSSEWQAINDVSIGGRNLVTGTSNEWTSFSLPKTATSIKNSTTFYGLNVGDTYTVRCKFRTDSGKKVRMRIQFYNSEQDRISVYGTTTIQNGEGYIYLTSTLTDTQRAYTSMQIWIDANLTASTITTTTTEYYSELKLEKGNKPTDWSPAPEDVINTAVDKIDIGGRNLILNSDKLELVLNGSQASGPMMGSEEIELSPLFTAKDYAGKSMVLSWYGEASDLVADSTSSKHRYGAELILKNSSGTIIKYFGTWRDQQYDDFTGRCYAVGIIPDTWDDTFKTSNKIYIQGFKAGSKIKINKLKLELGTKPTDWTPAPEDIYKTIDDIDVGSRNLLKYTNDINNYFLDGSDMSTYTTRTAGKAVVTAAGAGKTANMYKFITPLMTIDPLTLNNNYKNISFSFDAKISSMTQGYINTWFSFRKGNNINNSTKAKLEYDKVTQDTWFRVKGMILTQDSSVDKNSCSVIFVFQNANKDATLQYRNFKMEVGNKSTDWTPAPEDIYETIDNIDIGGRNLLRLTSTLGNYNSETTWSGFTLDDSVKFRGNSSGYVQTPWSGPRMALAKIAERCGLKVGDTITGSQWIMFDSVPTKDVKFTWYRSVSNVPSITIKKENIKANEWFRISLTIKIDNYTLTRNDSRIENGYYENNNPCTFSQKMYISSPKLEVGNRATDWTPATEDIDANINERETKSMVESIRSNLQGQVSTANSRIDNINAIISNLVVDKNGRTLMEQTSTGWKFNMGSIQDTLDDLAEELATKGPDASGEISDLQGLIANMQKKTAYVECTSDNNVPQIILGASDSNFKVIITNTQISFMNGSSTPAYISGNIFYGQNITVKNELKVGEGPGFIWKRRDNGNFGLSYSQN